MSIIIFGMAIVFVIDTFLNPGYQVNLSSILMFDLEQILHGQVWRLITFIFIPPDTGLFFAIFVLYFYWMIGTAIEANWGAFRFNFFYLIGILLNIAAGCITGYATSYYLNLTLFLTYAMLYPNERILLFFFIPVKVKWLAWIDAFLLTVMFILYSWGGKLAILFSIGNFLIFFAKDLFMYTKLFFRRIAIKLGKKPKQNPDDPNWKNHWWNDKDNNPFK
jgi:membrane associated rhomboid family serine protease